MKINQLKAGAVLSYISIGIGYLVSLMYTPLMLRLLGQSEYGLYNLVASIVAYLGVLNFGFGSAYIRYYSKYKVKEDGEKIAILNGMFLLIFTLIGLIAVVAGSIMAFNAEVIFGSELTMGELIKAKKLLLILVINLAISFPSMIFTSHIAANEKFIFQKALEMIRMILNPFLVIPVLLMGYGSIGLVITSTTLNIIIIILNIYYCMHKIEMRFSFRQFDIQLMKEMTIFSSFIFINMIVDQINWNADKLIIGRFHGTVSVAIYGLAAQLNSYYLQVSVAISSVFIPRVHRLVSSYNDNKELTSLFTKIGRIQFIVLSLVSTGFIFFGRPFIRMWAGEAYDESYFILLLLIIPGTITSTIQNIGIEIQRAKNMHHFRSWLYLSIAIVNIAVSIPLAKVYGGIGAATGTALAILVGNGLIMNWYYHFKVGLDIRFFWKQILSLLPALIAPIVAGISFNLMFDMNNITVFFGAGFGYFIIFIASFWLFGMNQYELMLLEEPLRRASMKISNKLKKQSDKT